MEEIRGNTVELDKPAGFVLPGVRNEGGDRPDRELAHRVVDARRGEYRVSRATFCSSPSKDGDICRFKTDTLPRPLTADCSTYGCIETNSSSCVGCILDENVLGNLNDKL